MLKIAEWHNLHSLLVVDIEFCIIVRINGYSMVYFMNLWPPLLFVIHFFRFSFGWQGLRKQFILVAWKTYCMYAPSPLFQEENTKFKEFSSFFFFLNIFDIVSFILTNHSILNSSVCYMLKYTCQSLDNSLYILSGSIHKIKIIMIVNILDGS